MSRVAVVRIMGLLLIAAFTAQSSHAQSTCVSGDPQSRVKACTEAVNTTSDPTSKSVALIGRADALMRLGNFDAALADTQLIKTLSPTHGVGYELAGVAQYRKKNWQQGIVEFDEAVSRGRRDAHIFLGRGRCLYEVGRHDDAVKDFDTSLQIEPGQHDVYGYRAMAYSKLKQFDKALPDINYAIWAQPRLPLWYLVRTEVLWNKNDLAGARRDIEKALSIDPENLQAKVLLGTLNLLTSAKKK